jgi:hypothetical protein
MIYLEEKYDLVPASPVTLDRLVDLSQERLIKDYEALGARLIAAWYSDITQFHQVTHVYELDSLSAFEIFREKGASDASFKECQALLEELTPERQTRLLEPLAPVWAEALRKAAAESQQAPLKTYFLAILETVPGRFRDLAAGLEAGPGALPIVASWRPITGKSNMIIDVWKSSLDQKGYQPADDAMKDFFQRLREIAPKERLEHVFTLPYSPLR